jgi:nitrous oxide reductase
MTTHGKSGSNGRREFLTLASLWAAAGAGGLAATVVPAAATVVPEPGAKPGYRETEHVKKAYEVARF